ncbi:hypothetical protein AMTRI_Chr05g60650 [Amborella trichopoda]
MYMEVKQTMRQLGFGWDEANQMVTTEPAIWVQYTSIEAMWKGEEIGVDIFLKASRHFKIVFLSIQSLLSLNF